MKRSNIPHRHKAWFIAVGAAMLILIGAGAGITMLLSGAYSTAATKQHFAITYRLLEAGLHYSLKAHTRGIQVPNIGAEQVPIGHACYRRHCEQCHGGPGIAREELGMGQLPSPSSLSQSAREWPTKHLYYVTLKGIRMSGMPAWEFRISDAGLWSTVAFLKAMPLMTVAQYAQLEEQSKQLECPRPNDTQPYSVERTQIMLRQYACDNCHQIDDVVGPQTHIGPSLKGWSERKYIAGTLPNTSENLVHWILDPQAVSPSTLMPDLNVTPAHARDMARYLLRQDEHR